MANSFYNHLINIYKNSSQYKDISIPLIWDLQRQTLDFNDSTSQDYSAGLINDSEWTLSHSNTTDKVKVDLEWLLNECQVYCQLHELEMTSQDLYTSIVELIKLEKPGECMPFIFKVIENEFQNALLDLVGFEDLEWVETKCQFKSQLHSCLIQQDILQYKNLKASTTQSGNKMPIYGAQVTVLSDSEKKRQKQQRKELKKLGSKMNKDVLDSLESNMDSEEWNQDTQSFLDGEMLKKSRQDELSFNASLPMYSSPFQSSKQPKYPFVFQSGSGGSVLSVFGNKFSLPCGSTRQDNQASLLTRILI